LSPMDRQAVPDDQQARCGHARQVQQERDRVQPPLSDAYRASWLPTYVLWVRTFDLLCAAISNTPGLTRRPTNGLACGTE
jgi:hypothetical protein